MQVSIESGSNRRQEEVDNAQRKLTEMNEKIREGRATRRELYERVLVEISQIENSIVDQVVLSDSEREYLRSFMEAVHNYFGDHSYVYKHGVRSVITSAQRKIYLAAAAPMSDKTSLQQLSELAASKERLFEDQWSEIAQAFARLTSSLRTNI